MTNGRGGDANKAQDFKAFDKLPKAAREALCEGTENYNSAAILRIGQRYGYDGREYLCEIADTMREVTRQAAIRNYGRYHPQAQDDCTWPIALRPRRLERPMKIYLDTKLTRLLDGAANNKFTAHSAHERKLT